MNREIKFRAWDKEEQNFMYFTATNGILSECDETYARRNVRTIDQYTGLKDKNGKEIYEGDIVRLSHHHELIPCEIKMAEGCWVLAFDDGTLLDSVYRFNLAIGVEVIGNIYENKELLEVHK